MSKEILKEIFKPALMLAVDTGMRLDEMQRLKWKVGDCRG